MTTLANASLNFEFDLNTGGWDLRPRSGAAPGLERVRLGARLGLEAGQALEWDGALEDVRLDPVRQQASPHGQLALLGVHARNRQGPPLDWTIEFALPDVSPFLLWRVSVHNPGERAVRLERIDLLAAGPRFPPDRGQVRLHSSPGRLAFYSDGYQSWSFAGSLQADLRQPGSIFGALGDPKRLNLVTPLTRQRGHFTGEMFGAVGDRDHGLGLVAGFLSQLEQFGNLEVYLNGRAVSLRLSAQCDGVRLDAGQSRSTDWACAQFVRLDDFDPLVEYVEAVARENGARVPLHTPVGWCSWYHYFDQVTEQDMLDNLEALARLHPSMPLEFVQLDDGYQAQVGDWFETKPTFPHGLEWLAGRVRAQGQTPGLWLAPYIVRSDARLFRQHPDWFIHDARGRLANAGFNWYRWCYGLDPTHPGVREHTRRLISTAVGEWGFPYLKLDFLYAAALPGRLHDSGMTRAQAMRLALRDIREAAGPDTFLLACGCPLGSAIGLVDGMRISTDVAPDWHPHLFSPALAPLLRREQDFVASRNAIRNTLNRAPFHRRWWLNDPDCLLVRDHDTRLTEVEVRSLVSVIALSGGMFLLSDDMSQLNTARHRYVKPLLPVLGVSARARDWIETDMPETFVLPMSGACGEWRVAGLFNWQERARDRVIDLRQLGLDPARDHYASDFWQGTHSLLPAGQTIQLKDIPPHGGHLLALRPVEAPPQLVASSFHFSQGGEVAEWQAEADGLRFVMDLGHEDEGEVRLRLPAAPRQARADGQPASVSDLGGGVYALRFAVRRRAEVEVRWPPA